MGLGLQAPEHDADVAAIGIPGCWRRHRPGGWRLEAVEAHRGVRGATVDRGLNDCRGGAWDATGVRRSLRHLDLVARAGAAGGHGAAEGQQQEGDVVPVGLNCGVERGLAEDVVGFELGATVYRVAGSGTVATVNGVEQGIVGGHLGRVFGRGCGLGVGDRAGDGGGRGFGRIILGLRGALGAFLGVGFGGGFLFRVGFREGGRDMQSEVEGGHDGGDAGGGE